MSLTLYHFEDTCQKQRCNTTPYTWFIIMLDTDMFLFLNQTSNFYISLISKRDTSCSLFPILDSLRITVSLHFPAHPVPSTVMDNDRPNFIHTYQNDLHTHNYTAFSKLFFLLILIATLDKFEYSGYFCWCSIFFFDMSH